MIEYYKNLSLENLPYINEEGLICWEEFKDIPDYEGLYQVSDLGRVKSLSRIILKHGKYPSQSKEKILSSRVNKYGYVTLNLYKESVRKTKLVHQLVMAGFLNHVQIGRELVVNHINFIKCDNQLYNLEIVTTRENTNQKHIKSTSEHIGVYWHKTKFKWGSVINIDSKQIHLGYFDDELEASEYYKNALISIQNKSEIQVRRKITSSKYMHVHWNKRNKNWTATIVVDKKIKYIGSYSLEIEAHYAVEKFKKELIK